jgi:hypothetical protein
VRKVLKEHSVYKELKVQHKEHKVLKVIKET